MRLAKLLSVGLMGGPFILVKSIDFKNRDWMFFHEDNGNLKVTPAGVAMIGVFGNSRIALMMFKKLFPLLGYSYETTVSFITDVPAKLLIDANNAIDKYPIEEIVRRLSSGLPLIEHGSGPRIIDELSDSQG